MNDKTKELMDKMEASDLAWMQENWEGKREQVFTHHEVDTGITRHIHATNLWAAVKADQINYDSRMMSITDDLYIDICKSQGIERDHLDSISPDNAAFEPALVIEFENGDHIIVDGNHKIVRAYEMGLRRRPAIFVQSCDIEPYLVHPPQRVSDLMKHWAEDNVPHEIRY